MTTQPANEAAQVAELEAKARQFGALYEQAAQAYTGASGEARAKLEDVLAEYKLLYNVLTGQVAGNVLDAMKAVFGLGGATLSGADGPEDGLGWLPALVGAGALVARAGTLARTVLQLGGVFALTRAIAYITGGIVALTAALNFAAPTIGRGIGSGLDALVFQQNPDGTRSLRKGALIGGAALAALLLARIAG